MRLLTLSLTVLLATSTLAYGGDFIQLDQLMLSTKLYDSGSTNYLITNNGLAGRVMGEGFDLHVHATIFDWFYLETILHTLTDEYAGPNGLTPGQFRAVGLENRMGIDLRKLDLGIPVRIGHYHYSQHVLDHEMPMHHPVEDALEIQVFFYGK